MLNNKRRKIVTRRNTLTFSWLKGQRQKVKDNEEDIALPASGTPGNTWRFKSGHGFICLHQE